MKPTKIVKHILKVVEPDLVHYYEGVLYKKWAIKGIISVRLLRTSLVDLISVRAYGVEVYQQVTPRKWWNKKIIWIQEGQQHLWTNLALELGL